MFIYRSMTPKDIPKVKDISNRNITENLSSLFFLSNTLSMSTLNLVCEYEEEIVGFIDCSLNSTEIYLNSICVDGFFRRKGIGKNLLQTLISISIKEYDRIFLHVRTTNQIAIKFYEKEGFKLIDKDVEYYENGGLAHRMMYNMVG